jgi:hypothetical protein
MALVDEVKSRFPTEKLIQLTNVDSTDATTIDDARLLLAATDVEGDFRTLAGILYNNADARHVSFATTGVIRKLQVWKLETAADEMHEAWQKSIHDVLRLVTGNDRIRPKSSSELTPAKEAPGGIKVRPHFDVEESHLGLIPDSREGLARRPGGFPL